MDAKVGDWVVTPRIGKPVEVNALWYNALCTMADFARLLDDAGRRSLTEQLDGRRSPDRAHFASLRDHRRARSKRDGRRSLTEPYEALAGQAHAGFARFWNEEAGYLYDVLDGPGAPPLCPPRCGRGEDPALRPNQLFAVSLRHSPLPPERQKAVVDACACHLLTSHGLRSLAREHPDSKGHHGADRRTRDAAYHQGTVWGWLIGPFVSAHLRVYRNPALARSFLRPLIQELDVHCVGSLSEIFDGDPPHAPRGFIAQAWTVAEVLRVWKETAKPSTGHDGS